MAKPWWLMWIRRAEVVAGAEHLAAEGQGEVAVLEVLAGEGGGVDVFLQAVGIIEVVAAEGDEVGAERGQLEKAETGNLKPEDVTKMAQRQKLKC